MPRGNRRNLGAVIVLNLAGLLIPIIVMLPSILLEVRFYQDYPVRWCTFAIWPMLTVFGLCRGIASQNAKVEEGISYDADRPSLLGWPLIQFPGFPGIVFLFWGQVALLLGILWNAPWLASVAFISTLCGWCMARYPRLQKTTILALSVLFLIGIRLPAHGDSPLAELWGRTAGWLAEGTLEFFRIPNLYFANELQTKSGVIGLAELTASPVSGFALIYLAALIVFLGKSSLFAAGFKMLAAIGMTFVYYAQLAFFLAISETPATFAVSNSHRWWHADLPVFAISLLQFFLLERLIAVFLRPPQIEIPELTEAYRQLDYLIGWPQESELGLLPRLDDRFTTSSPIKRNQIDSLNKFRILLAYLFLSGFALCCCLNGILGWTDSFRGGLGKKNKSDAWLSEAVINGSFPNRDSLPLSSSRWLLEQFEVQPRRSSGTLLPEVRQWTYQNDQKRATITWILSHENLGNWQPSSLYSDGWITIDAKLRQRSGTDLAPWLEVDLVNSSCGNAVLLRSRFFPDGTAVPEKLTKDQSGWWSDLDPASFMFFCNAVERCSFEISLFCDSDSNFDESTRRELREFYLALRTKLIGELEVNQRLKNEGASVSAISDAVKVSGMRSR